MIAIIIVGYNSRSYLDECLTSLEKGTNKDWPVIFVDNASTDGSVEHIIEHYPAVNVLVQDTNRGFAEANVIGIDHAIEIGAKGVFCLNPDTMVDKDCLKILEKKFDPKRILQPAILLYEDKPTDKVNTTGGIFHYLGYSYVSDYKAPVSSLSERDDLVLASGAAVVIPTAIIKEIGSFDADFFMYHEDVDLSWRARRAGYQIQLIPTAKVWHHYHFSRNKLKFYYVERNRLIFLLKNFSLSYLILIAPIFWLNELASFAFLVLQRMPGVKFQAYGSIIKSFPTIYRKRKAIQKLQSQLLQPLLKRFTAKLEFSEVKIPAIAFYNQILTMYWKIIKGMVN